MNKTQTRLLTESGVMIALAAIKGVSLGMVVGVVVFDYLVAFTALGLGGLFRNKIKNAPLSLVCGALVAMIVRYIAHAVSGYIFFSEYADWFFGQEGFTLGQQILEKYHGNTLFVIYTLFYNGTFMIPEIIITSIVCVLIISVLKLVDKKQITQ